MVSYMVSISSDSNHGYILLDFREISTTQVFRPRRRFGHWWPYGHADQCVRFLVYGDFVLAFYSNRINTALKRTVFDTIRYDY